MAVQSVNRTRRAFTLIELLVVVAITAILMTIIVIPIVQSFNLTRAAQGWAEAQDKARTLTERIAHEINNARLIRDNSGVHGEIDVVVPGNPNIAIAPLAGYDPNRRFVREAIYNAKLDLVRPAEGDPGLRRANAFVNPLTGVADPTLNAPKGQISLPASPGFTMVRYWIGLHDPLRLAPTGGVYAGYIEPYTGLLQQREGLRDNLYVLYRAEVQPMIWSQNQNKYVVNKAFFYDQTRDNDATTTGPLFDDPTFFDPTIAYPAYSVADPDGTPDPSKAQMVQNWLRVAVIQTEVTRFDMIQPIYDLRTRQVAYDDLDGNGSQESPRLMTLIQFRPTRVSSEPATGQTAIRLGEETESADRIGPDVFLTKFTGWSNPVVRTYANSYVPGYGNNNNEYQVGLILRRPSAADPQGFFISVFDPDQFNPAVDDIFTGQIYNGNRVGVEVFDVDTYRRGLRDGVRANFSRAIAASNSRSGWLGNPQWHALFEPYIPDFERGRTLASFGIDEVGNVGGAPDFLPIALPDPINNPNNLPGGLTWDPAKTGAGDPTPAEPKSPFNDYPRDANGDPDLSAGTFSDAQYSTINRLYNKIWFDYPDLRGNVHRFLDLRLTPNSDGAPSPLYPDNITGYGRAQIVPGSERVFGPDQNPGPTYGTTVRYSRTTREPGPNQYKINFTNLPEPDYSLLGFAGAPPATYTATNFLSAVIQPRYKVGYLQFNSDPNVPLPAGKILVYYRFQFSQPDDVMAVDYDSRQLMTVQMTIRDYPQSSLPNPQSVTLYSNASVRNYLR